MATIISFRRLCLTAKSPLPVKGQSGSFQLYLAFPLIVDPGQTVQVDPGLLIKTHDQYYPMVVSDQVSLAHGLMVNSFNTLAEADSLNKDNPVCKLEFTVVNTSSIRVELDAGYAIARLVLVQVGEVNMVEVDQFDQDPSFGRKRADIAHMPKTDGVWFKRQYRQDVNLCFTSFFDTPEGRVYWGSIEEMRTTKEYANSRDKSVYEAKWVYDNMPADIKQTVINQFNSYKKDVISDNRNQKIENQKSPSDLVDF
jgi:dUTPase